MIAINPHGPALGTSEAIYRFLDKIDVLPRGMRASAARQGDAIEALIASGWQIDLYTLDLALANTTLSSFGRMVTKARLGEVGLLPH